MKPLIIANWKMNPSNSKDAFDLAKAVVKGVEGLNVDVVLCPPFVYVSELLLALSRVEGPSSKNVFIGSQDCFWENEGAFTGEVSPRMLKNLECSHVILGHSERKKYLGETLETVGKKINAALTVGLVPVICIGEEVEKEMGIVLRGIVPPQRDPASCGKNLVLVYEPEWAVSTNKNAKPETSKHAKEVIEKMRKIAGEDASILYGGSVNSKNARSFIENAGAQGVLVGASSLNAEEFIKLVHGSIF